MYTCDDVTFCTLESCIDELESSRLIYYMYIFQIAGFDFNLRYRLSATGLVSKQLNEVLCGVVNDDKVTVKDGVIKLTKTGFLYYDNVALTMSEWDKVIYIKHVLDALNEQELFLVCIVDMMVFDVLKTYGVEGLVSQKDRIKNTISALSPEYSEENFDTALKFVRKVKGI